MTYLQLEVKRADSNGVEKDITHDVERVTVKKGMDQKANTVQLVLKNAYGTSINNEPNCNKWVDSSGELIWQEDDAITVKAKYNEDGSPLTDSNILTIADALEFNAKLESSRTNLTIKAVDKTFNLLNRQVPRAYTLSNQKRPPEIIKEIIEFVTFNEDGTGTFSVNVNLQTEGTYEEQKNSTSPGVQTLRINNSEFPVIAMAKVWKPVYEWIEDLSTIEATNNFNARDTILPTDSEESPVQNRKMKYFVDKDNNFRWFYPDDDVDYTITVGNVTSGFDDVKSYNLTKSTFDIINFVIYNGGQDLYGVGTLNYYFDENTKSKKLLTKYKAYVNESIVLINQEIKAGNLSLDNSGVFTYQGNKYSAASYGFETSWGVDTTGFSDDDYNTSLRSEVDRICKQSARAFTSNRGNPRWKGDLIIKGRNFNPGELIQLTSSFHGINKQLLRIQDITHNITKNSWETSINIEEDDAKVGVET